MSLRGAVQRLRTRATSTQSSASGLMLPTAQLELARDGPAPLVPEGLDADPSMTIAVVIPSFRRGSGGHATIVNLLRELRVLGHSISLWLEDCEGRHGRESAALTKRSFADFYASDGLELHTDFGAWQGADVVLATGWQTVARTLMLRGARARAYLVQDHEPDFYGASAEALWAEDTYRQGLPCVAASPWLAELLRARYDARATYFELGVDHAIYRPTGADRGGDLVVFYARAITPRRAVPLGLLALGELRRRRPAVQIALYGESSPLEVPFAPRQLGVLEAPRLAGLYSEATVGMVLSLTNPSLIALEMMACGLPCVELASESMLATFGREGPLRLAEPDPLALCAEIEALLDDPERRRRASSAGVQLMAERTWEHAALQVEQGLRTAIADASRS